MDEKLWEKELWTQQDVMEKMDCLIKKIDQLKSDRPVGRWLTMEEATEYAKIKSKTICKWIKQGYIYGFKRSGNWIIDRKSIDDWYSSEKI